MPGPSVSGLDGVLVIAKPAGPTSHDVVALVRRLSGTRRVGHGGTLDPFAAGVLPLFLGRATRLAEYHLGAPKAYRATICLGETSTTDDIDGVRAPGGGEVPTPEAVREVLAGMTGPQLQRPPAFSAVKVAGRRAYQAARAGEPIELAPRRVTLHRLQLTDWDDADPLRPVAVVEVECSAGTYVRSIARDLGASLGCGAYLGALIRTASGSFRVGDAIGLDALRAAASEDPHGVRAVLRPVDAGLEHLPRVRLAPGEDARLARGLDVALPGDRVVADAPVVLAYDRDGRLVAVCRAVSGRLRPHKVLVDATPAPGATLDVAGIGN
jgi:tRNA pseudouridine55 synthase